MLITDLDGKLTRRTALGLAAMAAFATTLPGQAHAMTTVEASALIQNVADEVMAVVNAGGPEAEVLVKFEQIFAKYGDVPVIARSVLGVGWRGASEAQRRDFVVSFQGYLARKYGRQFNSYKGAKIEVTGATDQGDKGILIASTVVIPGRPPIKVDWQASDRSGANKMFNIYIEGISLLSSERSEVQALLEAKSGDLDALIADLKGRG